MNTKLTDLRNALASAMLIDISKELPDKKRVDLIFGCIFEALDYVKNSINDLENMELEAIKEADQSLINHVNRRL